MTLVDEEARRRIREDLDRTLVVEAAAGTGKTSELVTRIVAVLTSGRARLSSIVAVTFTEKAAGEMKLRLRAAVEKARHEPIDAEQRRRLDDALAELEVARIGTIHGFCADLLHERPVEARVDPVFEVANELDAARLLDQAFDAWLERALADPPEGVRRALRRRPSRRSEAGPTEVLRGAVRQLAEHRDFDAPWERMPLSRAEAIDDVVMQLTDLGSLAALAERQDDWLVKSLLDVKRFVDELQHRERVRPRDHDGLEAELHRLARLRSWNWRGRWQPYGELSRDEVIDKRAAVKAKLESVLEACDADLAAHLRDELRPVIADYQALKGQAGKLDFVDLLLRTRDVLQGDEHVRQELQERFTHLFVDEFQDTDPLQAEILMLLAADDPAETDWTKVHPRPGKLFVVGDPKQSIYRFRRADVALYEAVKQRMLVRGAELIYLTTSFRSVPAIQRAVNAAFSDKMAANAQGSQAAYVPLQPFRSDPTEQPAVVALSVPRPYSEVSRKLAHWAIEDSVPDAVGAFVDYLVNQSGWTVTERDRSERVPLAPRHVCLLLKRFQSFGEDVTKEYVRALEARRVPHVLVGGRSFYTREEIIALVNALTAIEWPDDELSVYATLHGPFFALADEAILAYREQFKRLHPLRRHEEPDKAGEVADALDILGHLHAGRNRRPIADTIGRLLEATRAHAGIANWPHGEQALANVLRMMDLARRFEASGATSFRAFVERLEDDRARGEESEAPVVEEGTEGVRIMTVHRAKGLEFPVVILCEPTAPPTFAKPTRYVDAGRKLWAETLAGCMPYELLRNRDEALRRDQEEAVRLTYVAATRARDLLVVPAVGDKPESGWVDVLHRALYPAIAESRSATAAPGCPRFGGDSVLERPPGTDYEPMVSVAPGLHVPERGDHRVVWWDPRALDLDRRHDVGLRQERLLAADSGSSSAGIEAHAAWQRARETLLVRGSTASLRVEAATALALRLPDTPAVSVPAENVTVERTDAARSARPRGTRFGTLVHAVLAVVPLDADDVVVQQHAAVQARITGAPDEERMAAALAVSAALKHPLIQRAARAQEMRRETPVVLRTADGALVEGVIDLAFRESEPHWTIVDFKTDHDLEIHRAVYTAQLSLYANAIALATGEATSCVLLAV